MLISDEQAERISGTRYEPGFPVAEYDGLAQAIAGEPGGAVGLDGAVMDIAERKQAEERSREAEDGSALADNIPQLAWMTRPDGSSFWYNHRWYEYTGATFGRWKVGAGSRSTIRRSCPGCWRVPGSHRQRRAVGGHLPAERHDGEYRWHLSRAMPVRDEQGRIVQWFGTNTDITEQRELAQALKEADRRKDEFLATLAHELRNPLAPIRNAVQILETARPDRAEQDGAGT